MYVWWCNCTHVSTNSCLCVFACAWACVWRMCYGGSGIRNRLRGNWTAVGQEGGRKEGREGGMVGRPLSSGSSSSLWHDYSVPPEQASHQLVCRGLERGKKWIIFLSPECIPVCVSVLRGPYAASGGLQEHAACRVQDIYLSIYLLNSLCSRFSNKNLSFHVTECSIIISSVTG